MIFKWTVYYLLKCIKFSVRKNKTLKKYWKMEKNTGKVREKSGNFVSPEKWEPCRGGILQDTVNECVFVFLFVLISILFSMFSMLSTCEIRWNIVFLNRYINSRLCFNDILGSWGWRRGWFRRQWRDGRWIRRIRWGGGRRERWWW